MDMIQYVMKNVGLVSRMHFWEFDAAHSQFWPTGLICSRASFPEFLFMGICEVRVERIDDFIGFLLRCIPLA